MDNPRYPRSNGYDHAWVRENVMGPHVLWLTEAVTADMELNPGMRVLDLGCGKAISSVFLAREFGARVFAADLWVRPTDNWERIQAALRARTDIAEAIVPLHAEAHALPFADGYFEAVVSIDAYHYFGTDDMYLPTLARLVRPGGQIGIALPGLVDEHDTVPNHLKPYWQPGFGSFHSPRWWRRHWERSDSGVTVEVAELVDGGWSDWRDWDRYCTDHKVGMPDVAAREAEMLEVDAGRTLGLVKMIGRVGSGPLGE